MRIKSYENKQFSSSLHKKILATPDRRSSNLQFYSIIKSFKLLLVMICLLTPSVGVARSDANKLIITINQFVNHIALDSAHLGLKTALSDKGYLPEKIELIYGNAQGNISNSAMISKYHTSLHPHIMIAIATPALQTNLKAQETISNDTITAFLAVTDLSGMNLNKQKYVIGVTDSPPIKELFIITKMLFNDLKTVGILYNAGEINSVKIVSDLQKIAADSNFAIKPIAVSNSSDIKGAMAKLQGAVDLVYLPQDNTIISALDSVIAHAKKQDIPLIANDPTLVEKGVLLGLGTNYYNSGQQLGNMISDILAGKEPEVMIQNPSIHELKINFEMVDKLNIKIPESIIQDKRLAR